MLKKALSQPKLRIGDITNAGQGAHQKLDQFPFKPVQDRVMVKVIPSDGLIVKGKSITLRMPNNSDHMKSNIGLVMAVGVGRTKDDTMSVKVGDKIVFGMQYGTHVAVEYQDYLIMRQDLILFVYDDKADIGFRMLMDKILVLPDKVQTETKSGLNIPSVAREIARRGTVVAVGEKVLNETVPVKAKDIIHYYANSGHFGLTLKDVKLKQKTDDYIILQPPQVMGIYTGKNG